MSAKTPYRAGTIARERRSPARMNLLDDQIVAVLREDHPQSVRHVFYRMTDPRLAEFVEKSDRGYRHVQDRCVKLRRAGRIPYHWIADMSRRGYFVNTFENASDFLRQMGGLYRADLWRDADYRCEVWAESRSIASVLLADCKELAVDLFPCGGFSSLSFIHEAAQQHNASDDTRPLVVLYVGDYDPAGVLIDVALERELRLHLCADSFEMEFRRLAITEAQVAIYDLPTKPRKETDRRALHIDVAVEAESMPARTLRQIVRDSVEDYLPAGALEVTRTAEESERAYLMTMADIMSARSGA